MTQVFGLTSRNPSDRYATQLPCLRISPGAAQKQSPVDKKIPRSDIHVVDPLSLSPAVSWQCIPPFGPCGENPASTDSFVPNLIMMALRHPEGSPEKTFPAQSPGQTEKPTEVEHSDNKEENNVPPLPNIYTSQAVMTSGTVC